ncbi:hypothetical protein FC764_13615 [Clostridium botulinum]|nr:hypothetical protein [Clostridium botulinum]
MAKTIKFNLILDGNSVRTIEDLRENFSIEDILEYYNNGLLQRWLEVRGYSELLEKVKSIHEEDDIEIITKLITIFQVEMEAQKVKEGVAILKYINERKIQFDDYNKLKFKTQSVIDDYHSGYIKLIYDIIENADDMAKIKANIKNLKDNYFELFKYNFHKLHFNLKEKAPMAIFSILMDEELRYYFIGTWAEKEDEEFKEESKLYDVEYSKYSSEVYEDIVNYIKDEKNLEEILGDNLHKYSANTKEFWDDIEPEDKKILVLKIDIGSQIKNKKSINEKFEYNEVNDRFRILNGLSYRSHTENNKILYMEV